VPIEGEAVRACAKLANNGASRKGIELWNYVSLLHKYFFKGFVE
jgi:hypothetical protein